jgi:hypothetical protein
MYNFSSSPAVRRAPAKSILRRDECGSALVLLAQTYWLILVGFGWGVLALGMLDIVLR